MHLHVLSPIVSFPFHVPRVHTVFVSACSRGSAYPEACPVLPLTCPLSRTSSKCGIDSPPVSYPLPSIFTREWHQDVLRTQDSGRHLFDNCSATLTRRIPALPGRFCCFRPPVIWGQRGRQFHRALLSLCPARRRPLHRAIPHRGGAPSPPLSQVASPLWTFRTWELPEALQQMWTHPPKCPSK